MIERIDKLIKMADLMNHSLLLSELKELRYDITTAEMIEAAKLGQKLTIHNVTVTCPECKSDSTIDELIDFTENYKRRH